MDKTDERHLEQSELTEDMLHFDLGLTYEQLEAMEGCTKMPIKRSIDRAIEKIRVALKNF